MLNTVTLNLYIIEICECARQLNNISELGVFCKEHWVKIHSQKNK